MCIHKGEFVCMFKYFDSLASVELWWSLYEESLSMNSLVSMFALK